MKVRFEPEKKFQAVRDNGLQVNYGAGKRALPKWRWYLLLLLVSSPLWLFALNLLTGWLWVKGIAVIEAHSWLETSPQAGRVQQILVQPGEQVQAGQALLRLSSPELENRRQLLQAERDSLKQQQQQWQQYQQQRIEQLQRVNPPIAVEPSASQIRQQQFAQQQVEFWQRRLNQMQWLQQQQAATQAEVASARLQLEAALANQAGLQKSTVPVTPAPTLVAEPVPAAWPLRLAQIDTELSLLQTQQQQLQLVASQAGVVSELLVASGEQVASAAPLVRIEALGEPQLKAYLSPKYHAFAKLGQTGHLQLPNGESLSVEIVQVSALTSLLPARLAPALSEPGPQLLVRLQSEKPLPPTLKVNALALPLVLDFSWLKRWQAWWDPFGV